MSAAANEEYVSGIAGGYLNKRHGGYLNKRHGTPRAPKMRWTAEADRELPCFGLGKEILPKEYQAIAQSFPEKPTAKAVQERLSKLRGEQYRSIDQLPGIGGPEVFIHEAYETHPADLQGYASSKVRLHARATLTLYNPPSIATLANLKPKSRPQHDVQAGRFGDLEEAARMLLTLGQSDPAPVLRKPFQREDNWIPSTTIPDTRPELKLAGGASPKKRSAASMTGEDDPSERGRAGKKPCSTANVVDASPEKRSAAGVTGDDDPSEGTRAGKKPRRTANVVDPRGMKKKAAKTNLQITATKRSGAQGNSLMLNPQRSITADTLAAAANANLAARPATPATTTPASKALVLNTPAAKAQAATTPWPCPSHEALRRAYDMVLADGDSYAALQEARRKRDNLARHDACREMKKGGKDVMHDEGSSSEQSLAVESEEGG